MATKPTVASLQATIAKLQAALQDSEAHVHKLHIIIGKRYSGKATPNTTPVGESYPKYHEALAALRAAGKGKIQGNKDTGFVLVM